MEFASRQEWLEWRHKGIGSSDSPIIAGKSPWSTPLKLWDSKVSPFVTETPPNYQQDLGNQAEPKIRAMFELMKGRKFPAACFDLEQFPFIKVSLDGYNEMESWFIEIKLSGKDDYETACRGVIPEKYRIQVQHQFLFGAKKCSFLCYPFKEFEKTRTIKSALLKEVVELPNKKMMGEILQNGIKFWDHVTSKKPPMAGDKDYVALTGHAPKAKEWKALAKKLAQIEKNKKDVEAQMEVIEKYLIVEAEKTGFQRLLCAGIKMTLGSRIGNVDYSIIPELKGVDLDKFRKKGTTSWKFAIDEDQPSGDGSK